MPLILAPYTFGAELPASPPAAGGGRAYWGRRKRFLMYVLTSIVLMIVLP